MARRSEARSRVHGLSRRGFLMLASVVPFCSSFPFCATSRASETGPADSQSGKDFYAAHKERFIEEFAETNGGARDYLASKYGRSTADRVADSSFTRFRALLPDVPYIGGFTNPNTRFLIMAAWCVAWHGPMKLCGKGAEDTMRMLYDLDRMELSKIPVDKARAEGARKFSNRSLEKTREWAERTQQRRFRGDWVAYFIPGNGKEFDFGYDYIECGVVKYFRKNRSMDLAPYFCLNDFLRSKTLGTGLRRSKTLAQGDEVCNFRYKRGRPVIQDWETEVGKFPRPPRSLSLYRH